MKKIIHLLVLMIVTSCSPDYKVIDTKVVRGVISAKDEGIPTGWLARRPRFYVQSDKETITIDIPFADEHLFHVGDTICVVVKTVLKNKDE